MFKHHLSDLASPSDILNQKWLIQDERLVYAIYQVQMDYCDKYEKKNGLTCSINQNQVGDILLSYIDLLTDEKTKKEFPKPFFDEWNDRTDPYRAKLVKKVASNASQSEYFTLKCLETLYWAVSGKRLKTNAILKPNEAGVTKEGAEYGATIIGPIIKTGKNIMDGAGNILAGAGTGVKDSADTIGAILKYLPWIAGTIGAVLLMPIITPAIVAAKSSAKLLSGGKK